MKLDQAKAALAQLQSQRANAVTRAEKANNCADLLTLQITPLEAEVAKLEAEAAAPPAPVPAK